VCLAAFPAVSSAQEHGHLSGTAGATFQARTAGVFGGEIGVSVHSSIELYAGVNIMRNVLPRSMQHDLDDLTRDLATFTGDVWGFTAKARTLSGVTGVKVRFPASSNVRPYVLAGGGFANVVFAIHEMDFGDVTNDVLREFGVTENKATKPYLELGGGLEIPLGALFMDAGYRYGRVIASNDLNISRVYYGLGTRF
jgi:hypothetical protein